MPTDLAFANLLKDPPPTHAFELSEDGIAFAPVSEPALAEFAPFEPGVLLVSPVHDNIQQPHVLLDHIQSLAPGQRPSQAPRRRDFAGLLRARRGARFRYVSRRSGRATGVGALPAEEERPVRSGHRGGQLRGAASVIDGAKVEILAAVMSSEIVVQYEAPFRAAGFHPGLVTTSSLAALNLLAPDGITLLVKLSGRVLSVLVLQENAVNLARCVEMEGGRLDDIESVLHPTIAYIEDELKGRPKQIWLAGFGPEMEQLAPRWEKEWGVAVAAHPLAFRHAGQGQRRVARILGVGGV